ncbi:elongation factor Ts [Ancylomarina euxinus]|uniref:Elongation factor Ts n=1 Tax=Ancylomarina euxinus TaxID=2283627 RepID=A0A425Y856_9BACT|nr:translation elongation factor Ts [Ancylomarina euxinus]MCZ4693549.1 translation elongation factor Ts [Ancylomarina euxinus]MUP13776.1 elongation factor Ts [Ancylomarina euxinus]RRG24587.1 elongation factor Ts [Ancylomarina euxinus]
MSIKAADVAKLRKAMGAGMMDCKNALVEAEGDFDKAVEIIRKKGMAIANKRADREASEGVVLAKVSENGKLGAMITLNCETDFVAKNDSFVAFAGKILDIAIANNPADLEALKALDLEGRKIEDHVAEQTGVIGEKIDLSYFGKIEAESSIAYIHAGNKLATLIGFNQAIDAQMGRDVAMQAAAMAPVAIDKDGVSEDMVAKELEIAKEKARLEGKPEQMLDKIAEGRLSKFFKESTLLNQDFVKDGKMSVKQYLATADKDLTVSAMMRYTLNA